MSYKQILRKLYEEMKSFFRFREYKNEDFIFENPISAAPIIFKNHFNKLREKAERITPKNLKETLEDRTTNLEQKV